MKNLLLTVSLMAAAGSAYGSFLEPGSGEIKQVVLGDAAIQPIHFDFEITSPQSGCGLTIEGNTISGSPSVDSCELAVKGVKGDQQIEKPVFVEIFRLDAPEDPVEVSTEGVVQIKLGAKEHLGRVAYDFEDVNGQQFKVYTIDLLLTESEMESGVYELELEKALADNSLGEMKITGFFSVQDSVLPDSGTGPCQVLPIGGQSKTVDIKFEKDTVNVPVFECSNIFALNSEKFDLQGLIIRVFMTNTGVNGEPL